MLKKLISTKKDSLLLNCILKIIKYFALTLEREKRFVFLLFPLIFMYHFISKDS